MQASGEFHEVWNTAFAVVESTDSVLVPSNPDEVWEGGEVLAADLRLVLAMHDQLPFFWIWRPIVAPRKVTK